MVQGAGIFILFKESANKPVMLSASFYFSRMQQGKAE
jgi:hypothetical protein